MEILVVLGVGAVAAAMMVVFTLGAVRNFYKIPAADEALVKIGGAKPVVSTGGQWVIPLFHRSTRVSLKAVRIPIDRRGEHALPTSNKIMAEIMGELIVRVSPDDPAHIILAAQALGAAEPEQMGSLIKQQVDSLVTDALRTAAFKKSFQELNSGKKEFAEEVTQLLAEDLAKLGLTLTAVTIPHLKQGEFTQDKGDVFAAEGQRNVAETVAKARQETNQITRAAEIKVQEQDVAARRRALELELEQKRLEADQGKSVAEYEAMRATETRQAVLAQEQTRKLAEADQWQAVQSAQITQNQKVEAAKILQEQTLAVQRAKAEADRKVAEEEGSRRQKEAEIARQKAIEAALIEKEQAIKVSDEMRLQAVSEAEIAKQVAVAAKKTEEANARGKQAIAEAEQRKAEEAIVTVRATAEADRQRQVVTIRADEEAGKVRVAADRDAYVATKQAEAERDAAQKRAEAVRMEAEGRAAAITADAQGRAEAVRLDAEGYANNRKIRAEAEFQAADKEAQARKALALAMLEEGRVKAEAERMLIEARNAVARDLLVRDVSLKALEVAPQVIHELMAPVARVAHDVKILQVSGLGGDTGDIAGLPATILNTGLAAAGIAPFLREAVRAVTDNPDLQDLSGLLGGAARGVVKETVGAVRDGMSARPIENAREVS